jgi:hypothetical protein
MYFQIPAVNTISVLQDEKLELIDIRHRFHSFGKLVNHIKVFKVLFL